MEPTYCRFISTFTGLRKESKRKGLSAKYFCVVWKMHLGRNRTTHERNLLWNQWVIRTKNKCCHSILFCNSKSQYLHIRFSDPALPLVFWSSPLVDSSEVAFCLSKHIPTTRRVPSLPQVLLVILDLFLPPRLVRIQLWLISPFSEIQKTRCLLVWLVFTWIRHVSAFDFHTRGSWFESWNYSQFFGKVFVINCEKHKCFVIMAYRLCTEVSEKSGS